ncbi:MAG TPA: dihydroorotate dehydrogenase (quinone), partial [Gammaproteobacteria bacterium]|nr:dihydroorotate dehydrogenase (quinone) [Gammaproteobacteria bacterium]
MEKSYLKKIMYILIAAAIVCVAFVYNSTTRDWIRSTTAYWYLADNVGTPLLRKLDPEEAHNRTINIVKNRFAPVDRTANPESLQTSVWGLKFSNPLGIAAGFDKQAQAMEGLLKMGFGFVEVGGVTPEPQTGNAKPRMFRLVEDKAVINRYGLNSEGQAVVANRLANFKSTADVVGVVGVNIAKNTTSDDVIGEYKQGVRNLAANVDFIVLNVSCPNVAWTKELSNHSDELSKMICAVKEERDSLAGPKPALLIKLGPDMSD